MCEGIILLCFFMLLLLSKYFFRFWINNSYSRQTTDPHRKHTNRSVIRYFRLESLSVAFEEPALPCQQAAAGARESLSQVYARLMAVLHDVTMCIYHFHDSMLYFCFIFYYYCYCYCRACIIFLENIITYYEQT